MAEEKQKQKAHVNTSGWQPDEVAQLDAMVKEARVDRSKFLRALVRKEWGWKKAEGGEQKAEGGRRKA